jgi:HEAT repeat protein
MLRWNHPRPADAESVAPRAWERGRFLAAALVGGALLLASGGNSAVTAGEIDSVQIALLVDGMASKGSGYDAAELHALGREGLAAVLDHLLPDTAAPQRPTGTALAEAQVRTLIARLDDDDFATREAATIELVAVARGSRPLVEAAARSDGLEMRLRAERVLASWHPRPTARLSAYLSGFWAYLEKIDDHERLDVLARRTLQAFEQGMPEGDRLHLLRLCIAGVARGSDDASCDLLRPLVVHADERIATLVTETAGAYKVGPRYLPQLLVDALASPRQPVREAALRFVGQCEDAKRRAGLRQALTALVANPAEPLRFQACLPLMRDFGDPTAWTIVLDETESNDPNRVRTALNWIGDTKPSGQAPDGRLLARLLADATADKRDKRRVAAQTLGVFGGEAVIRSLVAMLADNDPSVVQQADASLLAQGDRALVRRVLDETMHHGASAHVQSRAQSLLAKLKP